MSYNRTPEHRRRRAELIRALETVGAINRTTKRRG